MPKGPLNVPLVHALVAVKAVRGPEDSGTELWIGLGIGGMHNIRIFS